MEGSKSRVQADFQTVSTIASRAARSGRVLSRCVVEDSCVLVLPSSIYASDPTEAPVNRFRIDFERGDMGAGLAALEAHLTQNRV